MTGYLGSSGVSYSSCLQAGHVNIKYKLWRINHPGLCLTGSFTSVAVNPMPLMEDIHSDIPAGVYLIYRCILAGL